ncbi:50S ribosomal protein L7ae-like protein [Polycladomyces subterraneus]|uniref:RNA-binding protein NWF35_06640 n=1 Tax=Polycladomyces subterraneus TaxID=1016997 RepID=A0ABT8ILB6_9BACL|nr:50S ribosomal protein L7ae-like protein [Polycladomyces subterraneus]MDN4593585.1 50S ribosomal protein L7ae-like protein [Polycladomyces subterraneus]
MLYEKVKQATNMVIGTKQTKKAIEQGKAQEVIVAKDADAKVTTPIISMCRDRGIAVNYVDSMRELGKACGIEVGAAAVAILK